MKTEIERFPKYAHLETIEKYRFISKGSKEEHRTYKILPDGYFDLVFLLSEDSGKTQFDGLRRCMTSIWTRWFTDYVNRHLKTSERWELTK